MGAIVSGIIGAVAIHFIQKVIEKKMKNESLSKQIDKGNEVLATQYKIQKLNEKKLIYKKRQVVSNIKNRHEKFSKYNAEREEKNKIYKEELEEYKKDTERNLEKYITENIIISSEEQIKNQEKIEENFNEIASLLNSLID